MSDAPSSPADEQVFSVTTLLTYMGNDNKALAIVSKVVRDACAPGMAPLDQAAQAIADGKPSDAAKIFHGLRGSIGTLGAKRLIIASLAIEQALATSQNQAIPALLETARVEYRAVLEQGEAWLREHAGPATPGQ
ncbi:MAG: Hpt domain-containing protein [Duganella sp.]